MIEKFISKNKKVVEVVLLTLTVLGSLFSLLAVAMPYLALGALKFTDGASDQITFGDVLIRFALGLIPVVPWVLFFGGVSAFLYTFVSKDAEGRWFLRIWGSVMMILFAVYIYQILQQ